MRLILKIVKMLFNSHHFLEKNFVVNEKNKQTSALTVFLNIKHMSYVSSGNKRIFYDEFVSMKKIISFFLWFFVFGCFYSDFRHFIINGKNNKNKNEMK